jgi:hypothetical protein
METDPKDLKDPGDCPICTPEGVCAACLKRLRDSGIPEATLEWLSRPKEERIRSVMF